MPLTPRTPPGVTAGSAETPHVYYGSAATAQTLPQDGSPLVVDLTAAAQVAIAGVPNASVDFDPQSPTYGRVVDPSGRAFDFRVQLEFSVDVPDEPDETADMLALGLSANLMVTAGKARSLSRKKAREGDRAPLPEVVVETWIGGAVGRTYADTFRPGWGETPAGLNCPAFAGGTAKANGFQVRAAFRPDPTLPFADGARPETRVRVIDVGLFDR